MDSHTILERLRIGGDARQYQDIGMLVGAVNRAVFNGMVWMLEPLEQADIATYRVKKLIPGGKPAYECTVFNYYGAIINTEEEQNHVRTQPPSTFVFLKKRLSNLYFMFKDSHYDLVELTADIRETACPTAIAAR